MTEYDGEQVWEDDSLSDWLLSSELTVMEATLLMIGYDPAGRARKVESMSTETRPARYEAIKNAISHSLRRGEIEGTVIPQCCYDEDGMPAEDIPDSVDARSSRVDVESLRSWLRGRGFTTGFFFSGNGSIPNYLNPRNPYYSPKLAAAIRAWEAVTTQMSVSSQGKHPKQLLESWLFDNAFELDLLNADGFPIRDAIKNQIAKVANWQEKGGAPPTPGG